MKIRLDPYKAKSRGCRAVADHLGVLRTTTRQVRKHGTFDTIINWGNTQRRFPNARYINDPEAVARACDKATSYQIFSERGVPHPNYTADAAVANQWLQDGLGVVARQLLRANQGRGIILVRPEDGEALPRAPLYTQYTKKATEYRVHVVGGEIVDVSEKRKRREVDNEEVNYQIRNAHNGWVYCRGGVDCPDGVRSAGLDAVRALGLDFGAADVGWNARKESACVYEVNTAPGMEGSTLVAYGRGMANILPELRRGKYLDRRGGRRL